MGNPGFVYVDRMELPEYCGGRNWCKIGKSIRPVRRLNQIRVQMPVRLELFCWIKAADMDRLEKLLHNRFAEQRMNGEWFCLTNDDLDNLKKLKCWPDHLTVEKAFAKREVAR